MPNYAKKGSRRCFDGSQDINWHDNADKLWGGFKEKYPQYKDKDNKELKYLMDDFFSYCAKVLVETPHGLHLDRIGYFAMTVFSQKKMLKRFTNFKVEDSNVYCAHFFPIQKHNTPFKKWVFQINKNLKPRLAKKIRDEGFKYYNHVRLLDKNSKVIKSN